MKKRTQKLPKKTSLFNLGNEHEFTDDQMKNDPRSSLMSHTSTIHPTVLAKAGTETVPVMFYSGAGKSCFCTDITTKLYLNPAKREQPYMEQMFGTIHDEKTRKDTEVARERPNNVSTDNPATELWNQ